MDTYVRLWRVREDESGGVDLVRAASTGEFVSCVAVSPDQSQIVAGTFEGTCLFYWTGLTESPSDDKALRLVRRLSVAGLVSKVRILGLSLRQQAPELLLACSDSKLRLYDFGDLRLVRTYKGLTTHRSRQLVPAFSDNGTFVIAGSDDKAICIWKADPQHPLRALADLSAPLRAGTVAPPVSPRPPQPVALVASADGLSSQLSSSSASASAAGSYGGSSVSSSCYCYGEGSEAGSTVCVTGGGGGSNACSSQQQQHSGGNKKIVAEESFKISDREVMCAVFIQRQSGEESFVKEGRFIIGGDKNGFITVFENPLLCEDEEYDDNPDSDSDDDDNSTSKDDDSVDDVEDS